MLIFLISFSIAAILGLSYTGLRFWHIMPFPFWVKTVTLSIGLILFLSLFIFFIWEEKLPLWLSKTIYTLSTAWLIILLYLIILFLFLDLLRLFIPAVRPLLSNSLWGTLAVIIVMCGIFIYGNIKYHHKVRIPLEIQLRKTLENPIKIVAISDLHLGYTIGKKELKKWVNMINAEKPDIILIGGDIVDNSVRPLLKNKMYEELNKLHAPLGVYACLGNHEYIGGEVKHQNFLKRTNIRILKDEALLVNNAFYIVGRDDKMNRNRKSLADIIGGIDKSKPVLLLDHQPYHLDEAESANIDFQFSGHTHNGQIFPGNLLTKKIYEKSHGYHRKGQTQYYISSGIGIWGGKFRIGTQSEYLCMTIKGK
ncbi:hypothetical protein HR11_06625 [Porphyromonas macacae]|uniref:metallophosphoesterase n=1 Tax=Porphyromonas macacae TaxID=28115 RepID=UPI00052DD0C9|nr:metallophosphoesterase [Porphyromonas macacae]KGN99873.1 hypothetical protein HR11_06625 [Porphyromonas macacae]